jgi:hypothetical protein
MRKKTILIFLSLMLIAIIMITIYVNLNPVWNQQVVDKNTKKSGINDKPAIALDSQGFPHISYGVTYSDFKGQIQSSLNYCSLNRSGLSVQTVDVINATSEEKYYSSLSLDSKGNPHISYYASNSLKYASWTGSSWYIKTIDPNGKESSLKIDSSDNPHMVYGNGSTIKYIVWNNLEVTTQIIDIGSSPKLALDSRGNPHVSYIKYNYLMYASLVGSNWVIQNVTSGRVNSLALDSEGSPHISYAGTSGLEYASWTGSDWSFLSVQQLTDDWYVTDNSLALDSQGNPHISYSTKKSLPQYSGAWTNLKYATKFWSGWNIQTLAQEDGSSLDPILNAIAVDSKDNPQIAYWNYDLKIAFVGTTLPFPAPSEKPTVTPKNPIQPLFY